MNLQGLNRLINKAGQIAAETAGTITQVYRPKSHSNPVNTNNLIHSQMVYMSPLKGTDPVVHGQATWVANADRSKTQVGDYLVQEGRTYFIIGQQETLSTAVVLCNGTAKFQRPKTDNSGYSGFSSGGHEVYAQGIPLSILVSGKGDRSALDLPLDAKNGTWSVLLPALPELTVRANDQIVVGAAKYIITTVETSLLGLRLAVETLVN